MRDRNQQYEVVVRPKGRTPADEYQHRGETFIEGRSNSWYEIELVNHTHVRCLAVLSVDGVGVIDGESASYDSKGFVLEAYGRTTVPGWLMNSKQAAKFVFSSVGKSYAEQSGKGGNPGVIGAAFFPAKHDMVTSATLLYQNSPMTQGVPNSAVRAYNLSTLSPVSNSLSSSSASVGTGWGESVMFNTTQTHFSKASHTPAAVMVIRYDSADNLQAMGIRLRDRYSSGSQAFPANSPGGYCKPPPVWVRNKTGS
jgi:hypothetical protein